MSERSGHVSGRAGILPAVPSILLGTRRTSTGVQSALGVSMHSAECGMRRVGYPPYPRHAVPRSPRLRQRDVRLAQIERFQIALRENAASIRRESREREGARTPDDCLRRKRERLR